MKKTTTIKKCDFSDFEHGMIIVGRQTGLSISETAGLLGFSCMTDSSVDLAWSEKQKTSSERHFWEMKHSFNDSGQRTLTWVVWADKMVIQ